MSVLGVVGIADKGVYSATATYKKMNFVLYNGSTWLALNDNLTGVTPEEGANWKYLARGWAAELLSMISAIDTSGLIGTAGATVTGQALIDEIADRVATKLVLKTAISNQQINDTAKVTGSALAYSMGQSIDTLNTNLSNQTITSSGLSLSWGSITVGGYTVIGNLVVLNIRVETNMALVAGTTYQVSGLPTPYLNSANNIPAICSLVSSTRITYIGTDSRLTFIPDVAITSGSAILFSAFYIKQ